VALAVGLTALFALFLTSLHSYLLFHTLVEVVSAAIAGGIFMFAWTSRHLQRDDFFLLLGVAFLYVGLLDLLHALAYHGMGIFPDTGGNSATQLWIAAGYLRAASLVVAFAFIGYRASRLLLVAAYTALTALVVLLVLVWETFPDCYTAEGLTPFKIASELVIAAIVIVAAFLLYRRRSALAPRVLRLLAAAFALTVASELLFTLYTSVYGAWNLAGHLLKLASYFLVYRAIIHTGLIHPSELLFHELKAHQQALERARDDLGARVVDRTRELADANARLRAEAETSSALHRQLRQAQKMEAVGTMAGGIAHDFNNILTPILGYAEILRDNLPPSSEDRRSADHILTAGRRAKALVRQILTFSRQTEQQRTLVDLRTLVDETLRLLRATLPTTITIESDLDGPRRQVLADPVQVHQILMNLCTNAFHAMRATGGTLAVGLRAVVIPDDGALGITDAKPGSYMRLTVADTGPGIPPAVIERIFEPYFTTKPPGEGTGLGLSIVHGIVRSHGGHVSVYSERGAGTTFNVYLPCADELPDEIADETPPEAMERGDERVVVVDDELAVAELLRLSLAGLGYRVTAFTSSLAALEHVHAAPDEVDLVLTDMTMPGMTGTELTLALRGLRPDLRVLIATGFSELLTAPAAERVGARGILMKPIPRSVLARAVRRALDEA